MGSAVDSVGSDKAELKKWLKRAADGPIHMAFAQGGDGRAVVKLDKLKQPRALDKALKEGLDGAKNHRYGTVEIDPDEPKVVRFIVNKAVGGFARKLAIALKGTGFKKVMILTDDGEAVEEAEGEEDEEEDDAPAARASRDDEDTAERQTTPDPDEPSPARTGDMGSGGDMGRSGDADAPRHLDADTPSDPGGDAPLAANGAPDAGAPDAGALTQQLTALVKQMLAVIKADPSQKAALAELATDAQVSLKRGDLEQAAGGIEILRQAIGAPAEAAAPSTGTAAPARPSDTPAGRTHAKAKVAWLATRTKMTGDLDQLSGKFGDAFKDHGRAADLQKAFTDRINSVLGDLDEALAAKLDEVNQAEDAAAHAKIVQEARQIMTRYQSVVAGNPTIKALDNNPFVPLNLEKTLTATLGTLAKALG